MPELSADAKAELQKAIDIVKADKQYAMLRDIHTRGNTPPVPPVNPPTDPNVPPAPPVVVPPVPNPTTKKPDAYWGELLGE